jgi:hypothetical protein
MDGYASLEHSWESNGWWNKRREESTQMMFAVLWICECERTRTEGGGAHPPACLPACLQHPALQEWDARLRSPGGGSGRSGGLATIGRRLRPDVLLPSRRQSGRQQTAAASLTAFVQMPPRSVPEKKNSKPTVLVRNTNSLSLSLSLCAVVIIIFSCFVFDTQQF